jgi:hypothetical protein
LCVEGSEKIMGCLLPDSLSVEAVRKEGRMEERREEEMRRKEKN